MTVAELVSRLQEMPPALDVVFTGEEFDPDVNSVNLREGAYGLYVELAS